MQTEKVKGQIPAVGVILCQAHQLHYSATERARVIDASQTTPYVCLESGRSLTTRSIRKGE